MFLRIRKGLCMMLVFVLMIPYLASGGGSASAASGGWLPAEGSASNGLNMDVLNFADYPSLAVFGDELYAVWHEFIGGKSQIRVKKYDGENWTIIDGGGLNVNSTKSASMPELAVFGNALYAVWYENNGTANQIRVKKYDGEDWTIIDGGDDTNGLNENPLQGASMPKLAVSNDALYVAWRENNGTADQIRVKKYDGEDWVSLDNGSNGLNVDPSVSASSPDMAVLNNELYVTWIERGESSNQVYVKMYDEEDWIRVDDGGLNVDADQNASIPTLAAFNGTLYAAWDEYNGTASQIRVKKYDGEGWTSLDGNDTNGLNVNPSKNASSPKLVAFQNELYAAWNEYDGIFKIRVKKYNGTSWGKQMGAD